MRFREYFVLYGEKKVLEDYNVKVGNNYTLHISFEKYRLQDEIKNNILKVTAL